MSVLAHCREVAAGPVVGYQVGAQGDGSGYIRQQQQQQQQHQQQQDAMIRGLSCISRYVHPNPDGVPGPKGTDGSALRELGGGQEVFGAVGQDYQVGFQPALAVLDLTTNKDFDCNLRAQCNSGFQYGNHKRSAEDSLEHLGNLGTHKDSVSFSSSSISDDNCSSSSIDDDDETSGDMEVESKLKGPLDSMAELEDSLPIKRGLSNFFSGKSKSFTCLSDVVSVKDLVKPDNPYNKRRRNLLAYGNSWEKNRFHPPRNGSAGIYKKAMHTSKSTLALAVAMSKSEDSSEKDENDAHLPPLPPQGSLGIFCVPKTNHWKISCAYMERRWFIQSYSLTHAITGLFYHSRNLVRHDVTEEIIFVFKLHLGLVYIRILSKLSARRRTIE